MRYIPTPPYMNNGTAFNAVPLIGGYNYYNPYIDPRYYQKQQEELEKQRKLEFDNQVAIWKTFIRSTDCYYGIETDEDQLNERFIIKEQEGYNDFLKQQELLNIVQAAKNQNAYYEQLEQNRLAQLQQVNSQKDENEPKNLLEFLRGPATQRYIESLENKNQASRVIRNLYDQSAYSRLLGVHESTSSMFNSLNQNVTIDDMEVKLPQYLKTEREIKRKQFMESILQQPKGW